MKRSLILSRKSIHYLQFLYSILTFIKDYEYTEKDIQGVLFYLAGP